jgi:hypothetical protein
MRLTVKIWSEKAALTGGALSGTEKLLADNGTNDGTVTTAQVAALAAAQEHEHAIADVTGLQDALDDKADAADLPANLAADLLRLDYRASDPNALGNGVEAALLYITDGTNNNTYALKIRAGGAQPVTILDNIPHLIL